MARGGVEMASRSTIGTMRNGGRVARMGTEALKHDEHTPPRREERILPSRYAEQIQAGRANTPAETRLPVSKDAVQGGVAPAPCPTRCRCLKTNFAPLRSPKRGCPSRAILCS